MTDRWADEDSVAELRDQARKLIVQSRATADSAEKMKLAEEAFELAQSAEALERQISGFVPAPPATDEMDSTEKALLDKARRWRMRAEEYRAVAEATRNASALASYLHLAHSYEALADHNEALVTKCVERRRALRSSG